MFTSCHCLCRSLYGRLLPAGSMCRVRFGLAGIHFDPLEPSRPQNDLFQPLIATLPVLASKQEIAETRAKGNESTGNNVDGATTITKILKNERQIQTTNNLNSSSPPTSNDEAHHDTAKRDQCLDRNRLRNSLSSSSSSLPPPSWSPSSDKDQLRRLTKNTTSQVARDIPKPVGSSAVPRRNGHCSRPHSKRIPIKSTKAPPAKRVRFAMDVQERTIPSDDISDISISNSSADSYIDPPSPIEPFDAFSGYYRIPDVSASHGARTVSRHSSEEEIDTRGFLDSEDGSEVDIQGLPVKRIAKGNSPASTKTHESGPRHAKNTAPPVRAKMSGSVPGSRSWGTESEVESHIDPGESGPNKSRLHERPSSLRLHSSKPLPYPRLRSSKRPTEPIIFVRPSTLLGPRAYREPSDVLRGSRDVGESLRDEHHGRKSLAQRPGRVKAPKNNQSKDLQILSVSDDKENDAEYDAELGLLFRNV